MTVLRPTSIISHTVYRAKADHLSTKYLPVGTLVYSDGNSLSEFVSIWTGEDKGWRQMWKTSHDLFKKVHGNQDMLARLRFDMFKEQWFIEPVPALSQEEENNIQDLGIM